MDGWDFLLVADTLKDSAEECRRRTSISRSYYAAYNGIAHPLKEHGVPLEEEGEAHTDLRQWLIGTQCHDLKKIGTKLGELRGKRNHADYTMDASKVDVSAKAAALAYLEARQLRQQFTKVDLDAAALAIRGYLVKINHPRAARFGAPP